MHALFPVHNGFCRYLSDLNWSDIQILASWYAMFYMYGNGKETFSFGLQKKSLVFVKVWNKNESKNNNLKKKKKKKNYTM